MNAMVRMRSVGGTYRSLIVGACTVVLLNPEPGPINAQGTSQTLPQGLETYLAAEVQPTAAERKTLLSGGPLTKLLPSDQTKEVFVFGAIWINASPTEYVRRVKNIEDFEKGGGFRITKTISDPPRLEDFAQLQLPEDDVKDLRQCRPGDCDVKLSARGLQALRTQVRWGTPTEKPDADLAFRRLALEYVNGYREGGNTRLAVYRDGDDPVFVANEFRSMIERAPSLARMPDLLKYLLEYPSAPLATSTDFLYWQEVQFGLKPTIRINHLVIQDRPGQTVIASKMLYASHYFWTALEQRVLQVDPARGAGFWFVTISRSRSDGLKGFIGRLVRGRVRAEAQKGTEAALTLTKARLEAR
jgi:hypothetical protein